MRKFCLIALFIASYLTIGAQKCFQYPFNQGDAKWKTFSSSKERIVALQIPEKTLTDIPTKELLITCLSFPYLTDISTFDSFDQGFDAVKSKFNGWREFLKRHDKIDVLFELLSEQKIIDEVNLAKSDVEKGRALFRHDVMISLLTLDILKNQMTPKQLEESALLAMKARKTVPTNTFGIVSETDTVQSPLKQTYYTSVLPDLTVGEIINGKRVAVRYTPNHSKLYVGELVGSDLNEYDKALYRYDAENNYGAIYVSEATLHYNCHAYAWHISQGNPNDLVWIGFDTDTIIAKQRENLYWEDSSYIEVPEAIATHISYDETTANHSAIKYDTTRYISKWGAWPLVIHMPNEVPYNTSQPKKYYIRNNFSFSGSTVICDSTSYSIENLPNALNVSWSIDNSHFTLSPNGTQCTVTFNDVPQYDEATLTATILKDTITVTTLSKRIVMQGTDMYIEGVQSGIYDENGDIPAVACTFTIPANNGLRRIGNRLSTINRDSLEMTSLPVVFENMRTITIPDNPTYGITEIYGGADIYLDGERLDGMTISFSGDRAPEYLSADGGTMIAFRMPEVSSITDVQGYYYVVLHATSEGGCHDFDLYFKVIPVEGETIGDSEISLYFTDSSVRVDFDAMEWTELPNGMLQPIPWYLRIFRMSTGAQMHYSVNNTESKTVDISTWPADVYIVRVDSGENRYTKKFLKQ